MAFLSAAMAVLGVLGTVAQVKEAKDARKDQEQAMQEQEQKAKTVAREQGKMQAVGKSGANIDLGTPDAAGVGKKKRSSADTGLTPASVGTKLL